MHANDYAKTPAPQFPCDQIGPSRPMTTDEMIDKVFTFQPSTPEKTRQYRAIREAAKYLAKVIIKNTPPCPDRNIAIDHLRGVVMRANAAIALDGFTPHF